MDSLILINNPIKIKNPILRRTGDGDLLKFTNLEIRNSEFLLSNNNWAPALGRLSSISHDI